MPVQVIIGKNLTDVPYPAAAVDSQWRNRRKLLEAYRIR
jgi:hypothetical protein